MLFVGELANLMATGYLVWMMLSYDGDHQLESWSVSFHDLGVVSVQSSAEYE